MQEEPEEVMIFRDESKPKPNWGRWGEDESAWGHESLKEEYKGVKITVVVGWGGLSEKFILSQGEHIEEKVMHGESPALVLASAKALVDQRIEEGRIKPA
jgi:hypothetical protein